MCVQELRASFLGNPCTSALWDGGRRTANSDSEQQSADKMERPTYISYANTLCQHLVPTPCANTLC